MKSFFALTFAGLLLLSFVALATRPRPIDPTKIPLVWTSDDNPLRREKIEPFNRRYPKYHLSLDPDNAGTEKAIIQSLAGVGPDLMDCWSGYALSAFVKAGIAWDVTDELAEMG